MQKIFDLNVKEDEELLWSILSDEIVELKLYPTSKEVWCISDKNEAFYDISDIFKIYWGGRTEIYRPIKEATAADIGKLCAFWDNEYNPNAKIVGCLHSVLPYNNSKYIARGGFNFRHCRRLTKQEIKELC